MLNSVGHFSGTVFSRLLVTLLGGSDIFILLQEVISEMEDPEQMGYIHLDRQDIFHNHKHPNFLNIHFLKKHHIDVPFNAHPRSALRTDEIIFV